MTTTTSLRAPIRAMYVGLVLTVVAAVVPYLDRATGDVLGDHISAGYPTYSQSRIDTAATMYLVYLTTLGVVGVASWLAVIRAVKARTRWAPVAATAVFAAAALIAVTNLVIRDTSGDTGLPPLLGIVGLGPCLAGLVAVTLLWRRPDAR